MDGRGRIVEPVTESADARPSAGAAARRSWFRAPAGRSRVRRLARQWSHPIFAWQMPRGLGVATASIFVLASVVFGIVRGDHWPAIAAELRDMRDALADEIGRAHV